MREVGFLGQEGSWDCTYQLDSRTLRGGVANRVEFHNIEGRLWGDDACCPNTDTMRGFEDVQRTSDGRFFILLKVIVDKAEDKG